MTQKTKFDGNQAIVMGGSIAGLMAARVLADHFERVTVIEKDKLPETPQIRKGVPQSGMLHALWKKGETIMAMYFPGLFAELEAEGATRVDMGSEVAFVANGTLRPKIKDTGLTMYSMTRVLLEFKIRERVKAISNVRFLDETEIKGFLTNQTNTQITGVQISRQSETLSLHADLVIDATGRGSRTPQWLETLGYQRVPEEHVKMHVGYACRLYDQPENLQNDWRLIITFPRPPFEKRIGYLFPVENNQWSVALSGTLKDYPSGEDEGFRDFLKNLPSPMMYEALKKATPTGPILTHKLPSNQWRHYEKMAFLPDGLLITGDAVCSFNPIYGQGMSVSALDALTLDNLLQQQARSKGKANLTGLTKKFQKQIAKNIKGPWLVAISEDLRYPETEGKRTGFIKFLKWYTGRVQFLANRDKYAAEKFLRVIGMASAPTSLMTPRLALKVFTMPKPKTKSHQTDVNGQRIGVRGQEARG
jgi:2-polyprenyl-6-methoxyphenol hydroxylase-like FAD-dependent oxidoreductase